MSLTVVDHPLAEDLLTGLRALTTEPPEFGGLAKRLATVLVLEATRGLTTEAVDVETPLEIATGARVTGGLAALPVLRAALGMLDAVLGLFPDTVVGFVGLERDETTLEPRVYYENLPSMAGRHCLVLDPMLATGGSATAAVSAAKEAAPTGTTFVCVVAAPEGVERMATEHPDVRIVTAALDRELNDHGYILPGLGDFGDRLFGTGRN